MTNKNQKGFALVLSLVLLLVMSLMGGALIVISSGDHQSNNSSDQYQQAFYVAETGLLEAEKAIINEIIDAIHSFVCEISPQGFFLLPNASRQCADTPIAKK